MTDFLVRPTTGALRGAAILPSDKSISHRAIMFAAIAEGTSHIDRFSFGGDNVSTARAFRAMGIEVEEAAGALVVHGKGLDGLSEPTSDLDCGNSGTTMRLLAGLLAGQSFPWRMVGDESLSKRPMRRVLDPLALRGATLFGTERGKDICAPIFSKGRSSDEPKLRELQLDLKTSSAQVKSALLLSGLYASGPTTLTEPTLSRDHTERMMRALGVPLSVGSRIVLDVAKWDRKLPAFSVSIPGDLSAAAFLLAAAATVPGSELSLEGVGTNPSRAGILDWLASAGYVIEQGDAADRNGEPTATLTMNHTGGRAARLAGDLLVRAIDEVPAICAIAASLSGVTTIADAHELRVKESDRIQTSAGVLRSFGLSVEEYPDGLSVEGKPDGVLKACEIDSHGDHRIAMMAAILALRADGPCLIKDVDCVDTSFPKFAETLRSIGADVR